MPQNPPPTYSLSVRLLHIVIALAVITAATLGLVASDMPSGPEKGQLFFWHKSLGVLVLALAVFFALNRLWRGSPPPPANQQGWEHAAARLVHGLLYLLIFALPLNGWFGSSAYGYPPSFFGLFTLPPLVTPNRELGKAIMEVHEVLAYTLIALVALHVAAALYHAVLRRDGVLTRIVTGRSLP